MPKTQTQKHRNTETQKPVTIQSIATILGAMTEPQRSMIYELCHLFTYEVWERIIVKSLLRNGTAAPIKKRGYTRKKKAAKKSAKKADKP